MKKMRRGIEEGGLSERQSNSFRQSITVIMIRCETIDASVYQKTAALGDAVVPADTLNSQLFKEILTMTTRRAKIRSNNDDDNDNKNNGEQKPSSRFRAFSNTSTLC